MQSDRIHINPTSWIIAMGISYSLMAISLVGLPHDHDHEHTSHGSTDCSACFFSANHVGIEIDPVDTANVDTCISIHPPFYFTFISTTLTHKYPMSGPTSVLRLIYSLTHTFVFHLINLCLFPAELTGALVCLSGDAGKYDLSISGGNDVYLFF